MAIRSGKGSSSVVERDDLLCRYHFPRGGRSDSTVGDWHSCDVPAATSK